ncbi:MAG TPA: GDSL-type esterase/lipase family protein [Puia sp.]|jgi:lysophospholipase L1-like esterase|nr:GDSL-type esterase/lipase family protein [Puia sp.]
MPMLKWKLVPLFLFGILIASSNINAVSFKTNSSMQQADTLKTYLALGDSYTIGQSVNANEAYPAQTISILKDQNINFHSPEIIATTGWTTADLQNAMRQHIFAFAKYDIVTLLIGVNNQYQERSGSEYKIQFTELLQKAIELAGNISSHVIVLSIPDYSVVPFAQNSDTATISKEINSFNIINKEISAKYKVNYINVTDESRKAATDKSLITHDDLHYSGKEYAIWAKMLADMIRNLEK